MKFKGWMVTGFLVGSVFSTTALSAVTTLEERQANEAIKQLKKIQAPTGSAWPEIEQFQKNLWKAMALDPGPTMNVPVKEVPKELFSEALTAELNQQFESIKNSEIPKNSNAVAEWDAYLKTVRTVIDFRVSRKFPDARAIAKRGILDEQFNQLTKKIQQNHFNATNTARDEAFRKIENAITAMKEASTVQNDEKTSPFTNGNQFIWAGLIALIGFIFGISAIRMSPEFFEKFIDSGSNQKVTNSTATAATHTNQLNYARWLSEFESILAKLKTSQLTHERRIEEVCTHSEKLNEFANSLYADPRIKNEVNLEFRMTNLLRELNQQQEHTAELKTGDRAQINLTLEHCLKLCDAIESGGIIYQKDNSSNAPSYYQPSKIS